jgi:TPR repeat protein
MRSHASALALILFFAVRCGAAPGCVPEELFDGLPQAATDLSRLFQKAKGGDPEAQFRVGLAYDAGIEVKRDYSQAADWYRKAANGGNPGAQNNLAGLYSRGLGVPQSDVEALRWYMRAAAIGYPAAQNNLGFLYAEGRGVLGNDETAVSWYRKAASKDYPGRRQT